MAAIHKISEDFYEDSFTLIALHCSLEDFAVAYALNSRLKSSLKRTSTDLDISKNISFPIFEWTDNISDTYWTFITNKSTSKAELDQVGLFSNEVAYTTHYLLPEHKEVDYFLKIEQASNTMEKEVIKSILGIPKVVTAYTIETNKLKSKNNLIF